MSLKKGGQTCPICHAYLFEEDDIVYCPTCGAPHHRDCYNSLGHCGLEQFHGTDSQYDSKRNIEQEAPQNKQELICPHCLKKLEEDTPVCPYCGRPRNGIFANPQILFMNNEMADIDGVKAQTVAQFVALNPHKYLPKFARLNKSKKVSWNWTAFLFPEGWFFLRKMHKVGALILAILVSAQICAMPFLNVFSNIAQPDTAYTAAEMQKVIAAAGAAPVILMILAGLVSIAVRFFSALFGDYIYKNHIMPKARLAESPAEDKEELASKYGGINLLMFVLGIMGAMYLPGMLSMFIG